jgi:integrase
MAVRVSRRLDGADVITGLRRATVCAIRREHINLRKGTLFIPKPKGGADRAYTIPLSDAAMVIVERRLAATNNEWLFPGSGKGGYIRDPRGDKVQVEFTIPRTEEHIHKCRLDSGHFALSFKAAL